MRRVAWVIVFIALAGLTASVAALSPSTRPATTTAERTDASPESGEQHELPVAAGSPRFVALDVFVNSADAPLAAYQFELVCKGEVTLVGAEGGEHPAFKSAPYYDPAANLNRRIVVAAFSTQPALPHGRSRVARLMLATTGESTYSATLVLAADQDGKHIPAAISVAAAN